MKMVLFGGCYFPSTLPFEMSRFATARALDFLRRWMAVWPREMFRRLLSKNCRAPCSHRVAARRTQAKRKATRQFLCAWSSMSAVDGHWRALFYCSRVHHFYSLTWYWICLNCFCPHNSLSRSWIHMHCFLFFRQYGARFIALRFWFSKAVPAKPQNNRQWSLECKSASCPSIWKDTN